MKLTPIERGVQDKTRRKLEQAVGRGKEHCKLVNESIHREELVLNLYATNNCFKYIK